ncbi:transposase [Oscillospiraceae bacterium MB08-C2-2]|nr:transposase [Oscillospiraceae bacterium MB08-C2-2]
MAGKKGMKHYSPKIKEEILNKIDAGEISLRGFCRESGISRYAVQSWRREQSDKTLKIPHKRGRPRTRPLTTLDELRAENKQLKMENELMRSFLQAAGRKSRPQSNMRSLKNT